jgi:hypothetical protein
MTLPKNARTNALLRHLMRGVDAIRAPAPPFTPQSRLRFVGSIGELRRIRGLLLGIQTTDHHPIMQRTEFHWIFSNLLPDIES